MISIDDFAKLELKIGTVLEAESIEESEKLIKLKVDLGPLTVIPSGSEESLPPKEGRVDSVSKSGDPSPSAQDDNKRDIRQILAGIKQWYKPEDLVGKQVIVIANLEPRMMMGMESQGMLLAADSEDGPSFLTPAKPVKNGAVIK